MTQAVLTQIALEGGAVVTCDEKFLPASMMLPIQSHYLQTERFGKQIEISAPCVNDCGGRLCRRRFERRKTVEAAAW